MGYPQQCKNDVACFHPTYYVNPKAAVHIITGSAGCSEQSGECFDKISASRGPWSAFWLQAPGSYTYARLTGHNASSLQWQNVMAETSRIVDDFWILAETHGPRGNFQDG